MRPELKMTFGEYMRHLRNEKNLPLRVVASQLDIDPSTLGKIERDERTPNFELINKVAQIFSINERALKTKFLGEKVCYEIFQEGLDEEVLKVSEDRMKYIKAAKLKQSNLNFDSE